MLRLTSIEAEAVYGLGAMRLESYELVEQLKTLNENIRTLNSILKDWANITNRLDEQIRLLETQRYSSKYWHFEPIEHYDLETLQPGEVTNLLSTTERGAFVLFGSFTTSDKVYWEVRADDLVIKGTIEDLYNYGLIGYNPRTLWISAGNGGYAVWATPNPYIEYRNKIQVYGKNVGDTEIQYNYVILRYRYIGGD